MYFGLDGCSIGWMGVTLYDDGSFNGDVFTDIHAFWHVFGQDTSSILIDIPIGLPEKGERAPEAAARKILSGRPGRAATVFSVPVRKALDAQTYEEANAINKRLTGKKLSMQTWYIIDKIDDVDTLLQRDPRAREIMHESHPEIVFWALNGAAMVHTKKSSRGFMERLAVLRQYYPFADEAVATLCEQHHNIAAEDDVVDALALAVAARLAAKGGRLLSLPEAPVTDAHGLRMEIVYPEVNPAAWITRLHHAQITVPTNQETAARDFYCGVLNLQEIPKPVSLQGRGGFWLRAGDVEIHVSLEDGFDPMTTKGHLAYQVADLAYWRERLETNGISIGESVPIPGYARFEFRDPFANRVEMIQPGG